MRPIALHLEGFGVFRDPVDISFDDVDYFALVGPTGSGKSTVIDAICFALYGSIPRYGDERRVGRAVSIGRQEAKVSLTFAIGDVRYRATRVVRLRDGKTSSDALLETSDDAGEPSRVLAARPSEMRDAVVALVGLPFQHFTKCVVLPQGEFAKFLHDEPARRQDLLSRLLDLDVYERIGQRARARAASAQTASDLHRRRLGELAFATDAARAAAVARREALRELFRAIEQAGADDARHAALITDLDAQLARSGAVLEALATVRVPVDVAEIAGIVGAAEQQLTRAAAELEAAQRELRELDAAVDALPDGQALIRAHDAHEALAGLRTRAETLLAEMRTAEDAVARANATETEAATAVDAAREALAAVRDAHAAHALAAHLVAGEPCPVCEQVVARVPKRTRPAALTGAEKAVKAAEKQLAAARKQAASAVGRQATVSSEAAAAKAQLDTLTAAVANHPDPAAVARALTEREQTEAAHVAARKREQAARQAEVEAARLAQAATVRAAEATRALHECRDGLLRVGLAPPTASDDPAQAWASLATWAAEEQTREKGVAREAEQRAERARAMRRDAIAALVSRAHALEVPTEAADAAGVRDDVVEAGTNAARALEQIDDAIDAAHKTREQLDAARAEHDVAELLATELRADRFEKWLLAEALELLVASGSQMLYALSDGQYSLRYEPGEEFVVVDHRNADATRSIRTLSGGETFQASLALALALSDQLAALAAGGGTKLDAIFLDEGFGTLDADTLDTVAETIEALGTAGRMVGVVTHVPALAERVPVRYRVARSDRGATVVREDT